MKKKLNIKDHILANEVNAIQRGIFLLTHSTYILIEVQTQIKYTFLQLGRQKGYS